MNEVNTIVLAPAATLCAFMALHALLTRGLAATASYGLMGLLLFAIREFFIIKTNVYTFQAQALKVLGVSVVGVVGWFFASYVSLIAAETLLRKYAPESYGRIFRTVFVASLVTAAISLMVEAGGQVAGWWQFNPTVVANDGVGFVIEDVFMVPHGWAITTIMIVMPLLLNIHTGKIKNPDLPYLPFHSYSDVIWRGCKAVFLFFWQCLRYLEVTAICIAVMALGSSVAPITSLYLVLGMLCVVSPMSQLRYRTRPL